MRDNTVKDNLKIVNQKKVQLWSKNSKRIETITGRINSWID